MRKGTIIAGAATMPSPHPGAANSLPIGENANGPTFSPLEIGTGAQIVPGKGIDLAVGVEVGRQIGGSCHALSGG